MLNWSDLCSILTVLLSGLTGATAAHDQKGSWVVIGLFAIGGLLIGYAFATGASKLAYFALGRSCMPRGRQGTASTWAYSFLYMTIPILSLLAAAAATVFLTVGVLSFTK